MSIKIMDQVFDLKGVTPTEKLILLSLADHADESGRCYPSIDRLSLRTCLSERALQVNIRTLTQKGFITIAKGGGRGRANEYIVSANPAQETPFEKPSFKNTVSHVENPAPRAQNPAPDAPQSSLTIIEPVKSNKAASSDDECISIISSWASREAAEGFVKFRRKSRHKALTERAAKSLASKLQELFNMGIDTDAALLKAEERGWATIEVEWILKDLRNGKQPYHHQQYGHPQGQQNRIDPALANIARIVGLGEA